MTKIDMLYEDLKKFKTKFNQARVVTGILSFIPLGIAYFLKLYIFLLVSVAILIVMMSFVGIPLLKKMSMLKKEIVSIENGENDE